MQRFQDAPTRANLDRQGQWQAMIGAVGIGPVGRFLPRFIAACCRSGDGPRRTGDRARACLLDSERFFQLFFDFLLGPIARDRQLFDDEILRGIEHATLAKG